MSECQHNNLANVPDDSGIVRHLIRCLDCGVAWTASAWGAYRVRRAEQAVQEREEEAKKVWQAVYLHIVTARADSLGFDSLDRIAVAILAEYAALLRRHLPEIDLASKALDEIEAFEKQHGLTRTV